MRFLLFWCVRCSSLPPQSFVVSRRWTNWLLGCAEMLSSTHGCEVVNMLTLLLCICAYILDAQCSYTQVSSAIPRLGRDILGLTRWLLMYMGHCIHGLYSAWQWRARFSGIFCAIWSALVVGLSMAWWSRALRGCHKEERVYSLTTQERRGCCSTAMHASNAHRWEAWYVLSARYWPKTLVYCSSSYIEGGAAVLVFLSELGEVGKCWWSCPGSVTGIELFRMLQCVELRRLVNESRERNACGIEASGLNYCLRESMCGSERVRLGGLCEWLAGCTGWSVFCWSCWSCDSYDLVCIILSFDGYGVWFWQCATTRSRSEIECDKESLSALDGMHRGSSGGLRQWPHQGRQYCGWLSGEAREFK